MLQTSRDRCTVANPKRHQAALDKEQRVHMTKALISVSRSLDKLMPLVADEDRLREVISDLAAAEVHLLDALPDW